MAANHSPKATKAPALVGHKGPVICLDVNSSESLLASASEDNTVRIWNLETRKCAHVCLPAKTLGLPSAAPLSSATEHHEVEVALVKFISDLVVLVGFGSSLISYNLDTKDVIITQHNGIIHLKGLGELNSIDLFGSSKLLVACDEGVVELHISDVAASKEGPFSTYKKHTAYTTCAKYRQAPQSEDLMIVSGGFDSKVLVYDQKKQIPTSFDFNDTSVLVESGNVKQMFNPPYVHSLVLLKDGSWAAAAAGNGSIELLQLDSQFRMQPLEAHGSAVVFVDIVASSPSSLVTAGNDGAIAFWDLNLPDESTATKFIELTTRRRGVAAKMKIAKAALAPQKKLLASLDSQIAALKDAPRATLLLKIDHSHKVNWIKSLRNGTMFVADTQDSITCYTVVL